MSTYDTYLASLSPALWWKLADSTTTAADSSGNGHTGTYSGSQTYDTAMAALSPLLWWKLNDGVGTTAADSSGNSYTGTAQTPGGSVTFGGTSPIHGNTSVAIAGGSGANWPYIQGPLGMPTTSVPFTTVVWFKSTATFPAGTGELICCRVGGEYTYDLGLLGTGTIQRDYGNGSSWLATGVDVTTPYAINDGNWHMIADVVVSTGSTIFLDGVSLGFQANTLTAARLIDSAHQLQCGDYSAAAAACQYTGSLAEVALIGSALTVNQVEALYADGPSSGSGYGYTQGVTGPASLPGGDTAVTFDGTYGEVSSAYDPSSTGDFTWLYWFKGVPSTWSPTVVATNQWGAGVGFQSSIGTLAGEYFLTAYPAFSASVGVKNLTLGITSGSTNNWSQDGKWHMVACVFKSGVGVSLSVDEGCEYVAGASNVGAGNFVNYVFDAFTTVCGLTAGGVGGLKVGGYYVGESCTKYNGSVAQVAFLQSALTGAQLSTLYQYGMGGPFDQAVATTAPVLWWKLDEPNSVPYEASNGSFIQVLGRDASGYGLNTSGAGTTGTLGSPPSGDFGVFGSTPASFGAASVIPSQSSQTSAFHEYDATTPDLSYNFDNWHAVPTGALSITPISTASAFTMAQSIKGTAAGGGLGCLTNQPPSYDGVSFCMDGSGHAGIAMGTGVSSSTNYVQQFSTTVINDGNPHYLVLVFNPTGSNWFADLYVDAVKVLSAVELVAGGTKSLTFYSTDYDNATAGGAWTGFWTGNIGHVAVWNSALTSGTITTLVTAGGWGAATAPSAPVLAGGPGTSQNTLSWSTPANGGSPITDYSLLRGTSSGGESGTPIYTGTITFFVDSGVTNGTTYYYEVYATNAIGNSSNSNEVTLTPFAAGALPVLPPAKAQADVNATRVYVKSGYPIAWGPQSFGRGRSGTK